MATKILGLILVLTAGGAMGWMINNGDVGQIPKQQELTNSQEVPHTTEAADFVSTRPEVASLPQEALSNQEREGLIFMREEEKLARDVYSTLYEKWGLQIFSNIAQSEQTHTEAVRNLLTKYDITDPVADDSVGVFVNSDLQKLYTELTARGNKSIEEALTVGALIEDLDIADLQKQLALTDNADIKLVYENLMRGSRNHLRSFVSQLTTRDSTYNPQYITEAEFDTIITSGRETGSSGGRGWGKNR